MYFIWIRSTIANITSKPPTLQSICSDQSCQCYSLSPFFPDPKNWYQKTCQILHSTCCTYIKAVQSFLFPLCEFCLYPFSRSFIAMPNLIHIKLPGSEFISKSTKINFLSYSRLSLVLFVRKKIFISKHKKSATSVWNFEKTEWKVINLVRYTVSFQECMWNVDIYMYRKFESETWKQQCSDEWEIRWSTNSQVVLF